MPRHRERIGDRSRRLVRNAGQASDVAIPHGRVRSVPGGNRRRSVGSGIGGAPGSAGAATGEPVWTFELEPRFGGPFVYAVDARTGALVESFGDNGVLPAVSRALAFKYPGKYPADVDPVSIGYRINNPPKYHNGTVFLGTSDSDSLIVGGLLIAVDAETGAVEWVFNSVPQGPDDDGWELSEDTWIGGVRHGGGVWTQPAIDPELDMIFFNAANPAPDYDGSARKGLNLFTNSISALRLSTGELLWHFQMLHHDIWDKDMAAGPVLFDAEVNGRTVKGVGSTGKVCFMYMLNRETGTPINPIVETAVPTTTDVPGEEVWPTQPIPYTQRHVPQTPYCAVYPKVADPELARRVRPLYHPYLANEFVITSPGQDGGGGLWRAGLQPADGAAPCQREERRRVEPGQAGWRDVAAGSAVAGPLREPRRHGGARDGVESGACRVRARERRAGMVLGVSGVDQRRTCGRRRRDLPRHRRHGRPDCIRCAHGGAGLAVSRGLRTTGRNSDGNHGDADDLPCQRQAIRHRHGARPGTDVRPAVGADKPGYIGLQVQGYPMRWRNIRIREE